MFRWHRFMAKQIEDVNAPPRQEFGEMMMRRIMKRF